MIPLADDTLFRTMLLDYYGELLTARQREYYDLHYNDDLSLAEIAEQSGTSRQAVWDILRRADKTLCDFEEKTGLIRRAEQRRRQLGVLRERLERLGAMTDGEARRLCGEIAEGLDELE